MWMHLLKFGFKTGAEIYKNRKEAKKLIDLAKKYNFDFVKFQKRDLDIVIPKNIREVKKETPWGIISYMDYKKKIEFGDKEFVEIDKYCKKIKIKWFASAWDLNSLKFLKKYNLKYNKIASAMIVDLNLLREDYVFIRHQSGQKVSKTDWTPIVTGMFYAMSEEKLKF